MMEELTSERIAVVIPCYRVERHIAHVIEGIPAFISLIVAVDDACPNRSAAVIQNLRDPRVVLVEHAKNQGVGGAMISGYQECLRRGADIIIKMDGDGQMNPAHLPDLIGPLVAGNADYTKGNRWHDSANLTKMPRVRRIGNLGLSFLTKLASGQWNIFDPCNGYTAIHAHALRQLSLEHVARDYFFEISVLVELGISGAVVRDVPMAAIYGEETSSLRIGRILRSFPRRLMASFVRRVWGRHFIREFGPVGLFLASGSVLFGLGGLFGAWAWIESLLSDVPATSGTVMLSALPLLAGFQLLLQALVMDISAQPQHRRAGADQPWQPEIATLAFPAESTATLYTDAEERKPAKLAA